MKRWRVLVLGSIITFGLIGTGSAAASGTGSAASSSSGKKVLQFQTMVGVTGPFVGATNPIRGVNGGGLPWQIENASGKLSSNGKLEVTVEGVGSPAFSGQLLNVFPMLRPAGCGTRRGSLAGSCSRVPSGDAWYCNGTRCSGQYPGGRVRGWGTGSGAPARS